MQTKIYFASSVPAAFKVARQELGAEALFVRSVPTPSHLRHFGRFEVTFGWDSAPAPAPRDAQYQSDRSPAAIAAKLLEAGFSRDTAAAIASDAACTSGDPDTAVVDELTRRIPVASPEPVRSAGRTMAFIGPPGRGKTTSLVKIAISLGLSRRRPVRIYSLAGKEQMARFAGIPGTHWQAFESLEDLRQALHRDAGNQLRLIDTPGISPADRAEYLKLAEFFAGRPEIEKHLVLRAEATSADMLGMIARFSGLTPSRLLFTGLDEASSRAPMLETLIRSRIPAAFTGTGQQIPADLEEANAARLARSAWPVSPSGWPSRPMGASHALAAA
jgi:flagellar biosynthesis protein FlhF